MLVPGQVLGLDEDEVLAVVHAPPLQDACVRLSFWVSGAGHDSSRAEARIGCHLSW
ncbi:hypothetical protein L3Q67_25655 [Saccharothrix sp. AJ9571]|nr:hypothetical protein L3Q67_25655 [Saccharothrix sp. AJ9571]